jgi:hypothetical protein
MYLILDKTDAKNRVPTNQMEPVGTAFLLSAKKQAILEFPAISIQHLQ